MTEWETEKTLHVYDKRVIQTPKGATKEGRIERNLQMFTPGEQMSDDEDFFEHSSLYSFADLKAFKIVRHEDDYEFEEEEAYTDDEYENYDTMDIKIPLGGNFTLHRPTRRQIKRKSGEESPGSTRFHSITSP